MPKPCEVNWQLAFSAPEYFPNSAKVKYLLLPVHKQHRPALPGSEPERGPWSRIRPFSSASQTVKGTTKILLQAQQCLLTQWLWTDTALPRHLPLNALKIGTGWSDLLVTARWRLFCVHGHAWQRSTACCNEGPTLPEPRPSFTKQVTHISLFFCPVSASKKYTGIFSSAGNVTDW